MRTHVCACLGVDAAWASMSFPRTLYHFHLLETMATRLHDVDLELASILKHGAPHGCPLCNTVLGCVAAKVR